MREAAEKKKELEKQHGESVNELRTAQAQLGLLASNKNTEVERAQHSQNIESLQVGVFFSLKKKEIQFQNFLLRFAQSRIRELERKMELQNVRHDELLLELAALRRNQHPSNSSSHGSSQSLGAGFDLDSRGSSPGTCIIIRSADDEECGREKTRSLILRLSFARFAAILGQRSWIGYPDDSAGTERLQSGRFAGNGFGRV